MEKKDNDKIEEEVPEKPVEEKAIAGFTDEQITAITDLFKNMLNEYDAEFEPRILENIEPKIEGIAETAGTKAAEKVADKLIAELNATKEVQETNDTVEEKELPEKDESETVETEEEPKSEAGIAEPENDKLEEENKAEIVTSEDEDPEEETSEEETDKLEEKSLEQIVHDEIIKQLNEKSVPSSKFNKFKHNSKKSTIHSDDESATIKRDKYGRNLDYI